jgi:hypothetical protein
MGKPQEVKRLWFALSTLLPILLGPTAELDQSSLLRIEFQSELSQAIPKFPAKSLCVVTILKPHNEVVGITHGHYRTARHLPTPCVDPQVVDIMKIDVRDQG